MKNRHISMGESKKSWFVIDYSSPNTYECKGKNTQ